jgi:hypothetical protein
VVKKLDSDLHPAYPPRMTLWRIVPHQMLQGECQNHEDLPRTTAGQQDRNSRTVIPEASLPARRRLSRRC